MVRPMYWTLVLLAVGSFAGVQELPARVFESYEAVRVSLSADTLDGVAERAAVLAPLAGELAGADARAAADRLASAGDLKSAREAFGVLSKTLVPKFRDAKLKGVELFECTMVNLPWAQRGDRVQNPYMGKSMLTCGVPWKEKK